MKIFTFGFVAVSLVFFSACGGGGGGGGSSASAPSNLSYSEPVGIYLLAVDASPNQPTVTGTVDLYTIDPPLPSGLALDPVTGAITGQPTALSAPSTHTVTAANSVGATTVDLLIEVVRPHRFAYSVHGGDSTISIFDVDVTSGRLRHKGYVTGTPSEAGPECLIVHPSGQFAYAPNALTANVSVFTIDAASGWLDRGAPAASGTGPHVLAITPNGEFAYVASRDSDEVFAYHIDAGTGELAQIGAAVPTGLEPTALAIDHEGKFLFLASRGVPPGGAGSVIDVYAIDPGTGAISPAGQSLDLAATRVLSIALDPQHDVLQAIGSASDSMLSVGFDPVTGALSVQASLAAGSAPTALSVHPTGRFNYITSTSADAVSVFTVDALGAAFGAPTASPVAGDPVCVTIDPAGEFMYVARREQDEIVQYRLDDATGALTEVDRLRTRDQPDHVTFVQGMAPTTQVPRFVHVTNRDSQDVTAFTIDTATGALAPAGFASFAGSSPSSIAMDPRQRLAYVANEGSGDIYSYFVDDVTGILVDASFLGTPISGAPTHLVVDPSGRFLYVVTKDVIEVNDGWIATYAINPVDASLTQVDFRDVGFRPRWVTLDPSGQFLYASNTSGGGTGSAFIRVFKLDVETGIPTESAPDQPAAGLRSLAFHPSGRYAYAALRNVNAIWQFSVAPDTGALTLVPGAAEAGSQPIALAVAPNARFLYAAFEDSSGTGHVATFALTTTGNMVEPGTITQDGLHPIDIGIDPSGRFVYTANRGGNDVSVLSVDQVTGQVSVGTPAACGVTPTSILVSGATQ